MNPSNESEEPKPADEKPSPWTRAAQGLVAAARQIQFGSRWLFRTMGKEFAALRRHPRSAQLRGAVLQGIGRIGRVARRARPGLKVLGRRSLFLAGTCAAVILAVLGVGRFCLRAIPAGHVGVRYSKWSGEGVSMRDFGPGLHLSLPGVHKWIELPSGTETLTWREGENGSMLNVRTLDGTSIQLGMTIPYSIVEGEGHALMAKGLRNTFHDQARAIAEQVLVNDFGTLASADYSKTEARNALLTQALDTLNQSLAGIHLKAESILVESIAFSPAFEKKLAETQRERQRSRVLVAQQLEDQEQQTILKRRSEIDRELLDRRIELDIEIEEVRSAGQLEAAQKVREVDKAENDLRADADREYEALLAQGEAAVARAKELEQRLHGEILAGPGGTEYLALDAARTMRFTDILMDANDPRMPNPLNVEEMLGLFGLAGDATDG